MLVQRYRVTLQGSGRSQPRSTTVWSDRNSAVFSSTHQSWRYFSDLLDVLSHVPGASELYGYNVMKSGIVLIITLRPVRTCRAHGSLTCCIFIILTLTVVYQLTSLTHSDKYRRLYMGPNSNALKIQLALTPDLYHYWLLRFIRAQ